MPRSPNRAARCTHHNRHRAPGQQRAGHSREAGPRAPGSEAGEFDVGRRRVGCERFESGKAEKAETVVKVIDFGVAKALAEKPDAMGLTHGGFVGTPAFASPEQFTDARVDVRSDIYSLGATLWYLLTGNRPFRGTTIEQIRASQHSRALPIEQLKTARVPSRLISLLMSMLAPEPAARPGVRALTSKLQECREQFSIAGRPRVVWHWLLLRSSRWPAQSRSRYSDDRRNRHCPRMSLPKASRSSHSKTKHRPRQPHFAEGMRTRS